MTAAQKITAPDDSELLKKARDLVPTIRAMSHEIAQTRRIPDKVVKLLSDAGLMHISRPVAYGGPEIDPAVIFNVARILGQGDGSVAWFYGVTHSHDHLVGMYPRDVQDAYWASEQSLCASSYVPAGKTTRVEGGYRLTGKWSFCSGIDHCGWIVVGTLVVLPGAQAPSLMLFMLAKKDLELIDDWHVMGLAGTGSKSVQANDIFVPDAYILNNADVMNGDVPGAKVHASPLFHTSIWPLFGYSIMAPATGILRGAYESILEDCRAKVAANDPMFAGRKVQAQMRLAEASALLEASELLFETSLAETMALANADLPIPNEIRVRNRRNQAFIARSCRQGLDALMQLAGGRGIRDENNVQRAARDLFAISAHPGGSWDAASASYGSVMLGGPPTEMFS